MWIPIALLALAMGVAFNSGPKSSSQPAPEPPNDDFLGGGSGGGALEDDEFFDDEPDPGPDSGPDLPQIEEEPPAWETIVPCAADLKGFVLPADEFAVSGKRSVIVLLTCERESELEAEFHMACDEDEEDKVDFVVLHSDDIDLSDPDNADIGALLEDGCNGIQGAIGVVHYMADGPRLLIYDGFQGAMRDALSYPNQSGLDAFDVVDLAFTLAYEGAVAGFEGYVVEGDEFAEIEAAVQEDVVGG
jgi:hypothetical protein